MVRTVFHVSEEETKLRKWEFDPRIEKMIVKTLSDLVKNKLVGQTIIDTIGSVTVTSEIAYGLWEIGEESLSLIHISEPTRPY